VQKQIWIDCDGTPGVYNRDVFNKFVHTVGWKKGGMWLSYSYLTFNTNVPNNGHLPGAVGVCDRIFYLEGVISFLVSKV